MGAFFQYFSLHSFASFARRASRDPHGLEGIGPGTSAPEQAPTSVLVLCGGSATLRKKEYPLRRQRSQHNLICAAHQLERGLSREWGSSIHKQGCAVTHPAPKGGTESCPLQGSVAWHLWATSDPGGPGA